MRDTVNTYFSVMGIVSLIFGILFCITIFGCVIGIPLIIGSSKMRQAANMSDRELVMNRSSLLAWGIFMAIAFSGTIIGLVLIIIFAVKVNDYILTLECDSNVAKEERPLGETIKEGARGFVQDVKDVFTSSEVKSERELEQLSIRLTKLKEMKEAGLLTEEEYDKLRKETLKKL